MNAKDLITKVREIVAERPDTVYKGIVSSTQGQSSRPECYYDRGECSDGTIGCIFGQAAKLLGTPITVQAPINEVGTPQERAWCQIVQRDQDRGVAWGDAVAKADEAV